MLQRTISRQGRLMPRRPWRRSALLTSLGLASLIGLYLLVPKPGPRLREVALTDDDLRARLAGLRPTPPQRAGGGDAALARLGRDLFHDPGLSPAQRSCASCHATPGMPVSPGADGTPVVISAPAADATAATAQRTLSVANLGEAIWFGWDGRTDSLAAQALASIEAPDRLAGSRLRAINYVRTKRLNAYEEVFGPWPDALRGDLPSDGLPATAKLQLPTKVAADALATIGDWSMLENILNRAQPAHTAPAVELSERAFAEPQPPASWTKAYAALPPEVQAAVTQVYANLGRAIAAYERGLRSDESAFDRFAVRLAEGRPSRDALLEGFGDNELAGLKLFLGPGHCQGCHSGSLFSDQQFHNLGLAQRGEHLQAGRATGLQRALHDPFNCLGPYLRQPLATATASCGELVSYLGPLAVEQAPATMGAFKTPSLRTLPPNGPYMHDARFASLGQVLAYYNELGDKPAIGQRDANLQALEFTREELGALASFVRSLQAPVRDIAITSAAATP